MPRLRLFVWLALLMFTLLAPAAEASAGRTVNVAYAGSLQWVNETLIGPAFQRATGVVYQGQGGESFALAHEIDAGLLAPQVFLSLTAGPWRQIERHSPYAIAFAASPLCIVYNPHSRFAPELQAIARHRRPLRDLWLLLASRGFRLGRTNPATDPQGRAFALAIEAGVAAAHLPARVASSILGPLTTANNIFAEEAVLARLEGGQLDAASAFVPEAVQHHLPYIALPPSLNFGDPRASRQYARLVLTLPGGIRWRGRPMLVYIAPVGRSQVGNAFIAFVLSPKGRSLYRRAGYTLIRPILLGTRRAVPEAVRHALGES